MEKTFTLKDGTVLKQLNPTELYYFGDKPVMQAIGKAQFFINNEEVMMFYHELGDNGYSYIPVYGYSVLRYDLRGAEEAGFHEHPSKVMTSLGYTVRQYEGIPIGDCIMMEVDRIRMPLPEFLRVSKFEFTEE